MNEFLDKLLALCGETSVKTDEPMRKHTTFRAGGPAKYLVSPKSEACLRELILLCRREAVSYYVLGNGSNLLISDAGYDGVMIRMEDGFSDIEAAGAVITAGAGALLSRIAREALSASLTGFEFAAGIPGTLGGAVVMNAGAYGGEMKDVLKAVRVLTADGEILEIPSKQLRLGYRSSLVPEKEWIVLSASLELAPGEPDVIRGYMEELAGRRKEKQPLEYASAGSTFKRPAGYFAGKLIEDAGLRGFRVGDAQVSEKHCGFVINRGTASAEEIRELIRRVQQRVKEHSGVELETEVKFIGWKE